MNTTTCEYDRVCEQIRNTRRLLANAAAMRRAGGVQKMLDELDRLVARKHELQRRHLIPNE